MARGGMPGGFDVNALMKQAQQMQEQMLQAQEKLKDETVDASAGGGMVKVTVGGDLSLRSIGITSAGSSTTQIVVRSRLGSVQIRQRGPSARLKHSSQSPTFSFTSVIAADSAAASSSGARRMWKASRCAVRWPIPGNRESSATRRASGAGPSALTFRGGRQGLR